MDKLSASEITRLLENFIGKTEPVGETNVDHDRLINLKTLIGVTGYCLDGVKRSAEVIGNEYSVRENRETAISALLEWREWIDDVIELQIVYPSEEEE